MTCVVHGDDSTFTGEDPDLNWVERKTTQAFLCKVEGRLGPEDQDLKEVRILNGIITWNPLGIGYEADPRHAEAIIRDLGIEDKEVVN